MLSNELQIELLSNKIQELHPVKIVLFGSYAKGQATENSDIDILVVTNQDYIPKTFDERIQLQLTVSNHIFEISQQVPIDLLVYTKSMYAKFIAQGSVFANDIIKNGKILYEANNSTMA